MELYQRLLVSLVDAMKRDGYMESSYDYYDIDMLYPSDNEISAYFYKYQPNVVGLSAVVSTSYSQVKRISLIIRQQAPNAWIVMGGNLAACSEAVLKHTEVDLTVVGDGEVAWVELLDYISNNTDRSDKKRSKLSAINGVAFIDNYEIVMNKFGLSAPKDQMPFPDYKLLGSGLKGNPDALNNYFRVGLETGWFSFDDRAQDSNRRERIAGIFASKGCVAKCTFCQRSTKGYRTQPLEHLENHLIHLRDNHDVGFIQVLDENFGSDKKHSYQIAKILNKVGMLWMATGVRCTSTTETDILYYKDHGCSALKYGVESGSQAILDIMEKVFKVSDVYNALDSCINHGIYSPAAVMVGMPGETEFTAKETGEFIGNIALKIGVHPEVMGFEIFYALPLPGTPLWEYGEQIGVIGKNTEDVVDYLTRISDAGTYKRYYINLNGAAMSEVIFWEYIVRLEASRVYNKSSSDYSLNSNIKEKYIEILNKVKNVNPRYSLKYTALKFTQITYLVDTYIVGNKIIDKIPRAVIYPVIKYALYLEYLVQKMYGHNMQSNLYIKRNKVKRLSLDFVKNIKSKKRRSLRGIVLENRDVITSDVDLVRRSLKSGL